MLTSHFPGGVGVLQREGTEKTDLCRDLFDISLLKKGEEESGWRKAAETGGMCKEDSEEMFRN